LSGVPLEVEARRPENAQIEMATDAFSHAGRRFLGSVPSHQFRFSFNYGFRPVFDKLQSSFRRNRRINLVPPAGPLAMSCVNKLRNTYLCEGQG